MQSPFSPCPIRHLGNYTRHQDGSSAGTYLWPSFWTFLVGILCTMLPRVIIWRPWFHRWHWMFAIDPWMYVFTLPIPIFGQRRSCRRPNIPFHICPARRSLPQFLLRTSNNIGGGLMKQYHHHLAALPFPTTRRSHLTGCSLQCMRHT